ncbi:Ldh family oxidoreductase [Saccharopolyspora mangrovi]|uniref:Ldh family oxidoreductase n=1 Tax=Saccharopolyspora mangrovi TaxID=3082379 RepID=A0ABU6AF00_9PSEU|nr:Ldh family oxidoreductase [Saccharopolyspora sp. S2-29]MEB3370100.1 Ldh family oxidoreductase [Saccharopolyspora sp. S2-29]
MTEFGTRILRTLSVPEDDARLLADSLVVAELWGHSSHGMLRLPWYAARLRSGAMRSSGEPQIVTDTGSLVVLDGQDGIGQVITDRAARLGIDRAKAHGIAGVAIRNSNHFGTAAYFTRKVADAGCLALLATNASPAMAPWGGREKSVGTNPWSITAPAGSYGTAVMDIANTAVARGKIYLAEERGEPIPEGWAADANGVPTTDPREAVDGLILPLAGHKGYAISFMFDVLAGVLTGSSFGAGVAGPYDPERRSGCGHFLMVVDIAAVQPVDEFTSRIESLVAETKPVPTAPGVAEIFVPGEIEQRNLARNSTAGITLAPKTWQDLSELASSTGVPMPEPSEATATA